MSGVDDQVLFSKMLVSMPLVKILDSCIVIMLRSPRYWDKNTSSFLNHQLVVQVSDVELESGVDSDNENFDLGHRDQVCFFFR